MGEQLAVEHDYKSSLIPPLRLRSSVCAQSTDEAPSLPSIPATPTMLSPAPLMKTPGSLTVSVTILLQEFPHFRPGPGICRRRLPARAGPSAYKSHISLYPVLLLR